MASALRLDEPTSTCRSAGRRRTPRDEANDAAVLAEEARDQQTGPVTCLIARPDLRKSVAAAVPSWGTLEMSVPAGQGCKLVERAGLT